MFIDSHAHLNFREFGEEIPQTLEKAQKAGVGAIINVGSNYSTSQGAIKIAQKYNANLQMYPNAANKKKLTEANEAKKLMPKIYASVGIHPIHLVKNIEEKAVFDGREYFFKTRQESFDYGKFKHLAQSSKKVVAIGETGIDLFHITCNAQHVTREKNKSEAQNPKSETNSKSEFPNVQKIQSDVFRQHIKLAEELNLPLIIHGRGTKEDPYGAYDLIIEILESFTSEVKEASTSEVGIRGVAHCFAGSLKQAKEFVKMGFYIGFTGIVTFKNAPEIQQIAREIPLGKTLIETDCPFLAPVPYRGKRNEPAYVVEVARKIAELKNITLLEVEKQTTENAKELFKISTH